MTERGNRNECVDGRQLPAFAAKCDSKVRSEFGVPFIWDQTVQTLAERFPYFQILFRSGQSLEPK